MCCEEMIITGIHVVQIQYGVRTPARTSQVQQLRTSCAELEILELDIGQQVRIGLSDSNVLGETTCAGSSLVRCHCLMLHNCAQATMSSVSPCWTRPDPSLHTIDYFSS